MFHFPLLHPLAELCKWTSIINDHHHQFRKNMKELLVSTGKLLQSLTDKGTEDQGSYVFADKTCPIDVSMTTTLRPRRFDIPPIGTLSRFTFDKI